MNPERIELPYGALALIEKLGRWAMDSKGAKAYDVLMQVVRSAQPVHAEPPAVDAPPPEPPAGEG